MDISRFRGTARGEDVFSELSGLSSPPSDQEDVEVEKRAPRQGLTSSGVQTDANEIQELSGHSIGVGN